MVDVVETIQAAAKKWSRISESNNHDTIISDPIDDIHHLQVNVNEP